MKPLTKGERETLGTILRHGGQVVITAGKKRTANCVHRGTVEGLEARGLVRRWNADAAGVRVRWNARHRAWVQAASGFSPQVAINIAVTAAGCALLAACG